MEQSSPISELFNLMATRRSPQGSGPKAGVTNPQALAPAYSDRLSQLEKDMAKIKDGTVKEVLEKLRRLSYEIEDINRRFESLDRTGGTLDDFSVEVDHYETETINLRRQLELGSAPLPVLNQQAGNYRFPIPIYSGERSTLSRFLKLFYTWALSHKSEYGLNYSRPVIMATKKSRTELEVRYGRRNVEQSLVDWSALTKATEKDKTIADIVVGAKAPSKAWKILNIFIVEEDSSERAGQRADQENLGRIKYGHCGIDERTHRPRKVSSPQRTVSRH